MIAPLAYAAAGFVAGVVYRSYNAVDVVALEATARAAVAAAATRAPAAFDALLDAVKRGGPARPLA